MKQHTIHI